MSKSIHCFYCGGWCYADDPYNPKTDIWCLLCARWQTPKDFKPLPYVVQSDASFSDTDWYIDEHGDIIDIIDQKIEELIERAPYKTYNVSYVAKAVHCSNSEARMTLERLVRIGALERYIYGPQDRWVGYRKATHG